MKNKMIIPIIIFAVVVIAGAAFALISYSPIPTTSGAELRTPIKETTVVTGGGFVQGEVGSELTGEGYSGQVIAGSTTPYVRYNEADFQKARSEGKAIYLYFYATWCPICAVERPNILAAFDQLDLDNAVGFEAHWNDGQNTEADNNLARAYGVGSQHTHIFIDKNGDVVEKTLAGLSSNDIKMHLTAAAGA